MKFFSAIPLNRNSLGTIILLASFATSSLHAATSAEEHADREARMAWWREARFGMFVHWGLYSALITLKGNIHYLHVFSRPADGRITVTLPATTAVLLDGGQRLKVPRDGKQTVIHLPPNLPDPVASVIRLE